MGEFEVKPLHCKEADFHVKLNGQSLQNTYLSIENIINAAKDSNVDAIHPGYGFLSENPEFSLACEKAKISFIGPSEKTLKQLGKKT